MSTAQNAIQTEMLYPQQAEGTAKHAYNPPQVTEIDVTAYSGQVEGVLRAKGADDVQAEAVNVVITSEADVRVTGVDLPGHTGTDEATLTAV